MELTVVTREERHDQIRQKIADMDDAVVDLMESMTAECKRLGGHERSQLITNIETLNRRRKDLLSCCELFT